MICPTTSSRVRVVDPYGYHIFEDTENAFKEKISLEYCCARNWLRVQHSNETFSLKAFCPRRWYPVTTPR